MKVALFNCGDLVYSYQNPDRKGRIIRVHCPEDPQFPFRYKLRLPDGRESHWIDEPSIRKNRIKK